jgi:hypothetical protein
MRIQTSIFMIGGFFGFQEVDAVDIGSLIASYYFHWIKYSNGVANINVIVKYLDMNWIDKRIADATTIIPGGAQSKAPKYIGHVCVLPYATSVRSTLF